MAASTRTGSTASRRTARSSTGCTSCRGCRRWSTIASWRAAVLDCHAERPAYDDWWQLPDGRLLHVIAEQRHDGGVTYLFDDATERLALEEPLQCADRRAARDARQPQGRRRGVRHRRPAQALQLRVRCDLAAVARDARRGSPHIGEIVAAGRALYDDATLGPARRARSPPSPTSARRSTARWCAPTRA